MPQAHSNCSSSVLQAIAMARFRQMRPLSQRLMSSTSAGGSMVEEIGSVGTGPTYKPIYVAATRQNVGKTSVSLALMSGLQKRFPRRVGFIKPVGQKHVVVQDESGQELRVDKDAAVVKQHFHLDHIPYKNTSPVLIPKGYTRDYLDQKITNIQQVDTIKNAFRSIADCSDIVLCEGTGHVAVGSIIDQNNASCAKMLDASVVLVANGGVGNSFDELQLNRAMCQAEGVDVAGVIMNKVLPEKYDQTKDYITKALEQKWGDQVPLLGLIPDRPFLGSPALSDLERLFQGSIVSGTDHRLRHFRIEDISLVATSLNVFLQSLRSIRLQGARKLFVCHASRNDILLGYLMESVQRILPAQSPAHIDTSEEFSTAMVVTGCGEHPISTQVLEIITSLPKTSPPVLLTETATDDVLSGMYNFTPKLNSEDEHRVGSTVSHYEPYIDFDRLLHQVQKSKQPAD